MDPIASAIATKPAIIAGVYILSIFEIRHLCFLCVSVSLWFLLFHSAICLQKARLSDVSTLFSLTLFAGSSFVISAFPASMLSGVSFASQLLAITILTSKIPFLTH